MHNVLYKSPAQCIIQTIDTINVTGSFWNVQGDSKGIYEHDHRWHTLQDFIEE